MIDGKGLALAGTLELPANGSKESMLLNLTVRVQFSVFPMRFRPPRNNECACPRLMFMIGGGISRFSPRTHRGKIGIVGRGIVKTATKKESRMIVEIRIAISSCLSPLVLSDGRFSVPFKALIKAWSHPLAVHMAKYRKCRLATT